MADEITYQIQVLLSNSGLSDNHQSGSKKASQSSALLIRNVQEIGFSDHESLQLGDVVTPGICVFVNLDDTNSVEIGTEVSGNFEPFLKLKAGEQQLCRISTTEPVAKADTGVVDLFYIIYSD